MGLEAPLALLGILAAALPFIAHRIRRRDMPVVKLATVEFLLRAKASQRRSHNLTDLLLLIARVSLLAALCMALSAPYVTARVTFGDGEVSGAVIVLDDSMSTQREYAGSTLLARGIDRASEAIDALPEGSQVAIVLAGQPARTWLERTEDLRIAKARLRELPPSSHRGTDLAEAVELALRKVAAMAPQRHRILVLSDFAQHAHFNPANVRSGGVEIVYEPVAPAATHANLHFASVSAAPGPGEDDGWSLTALIRAYGDGPPQVPVRIIGPGDQTQHQVVSMDQGHGRMHAQVQSPKPGGDPRVRVELDVDDALSADNRRDVLLGGQVAVRVLLVNGDPHPASVRDELHYFARSLPLSPQGVLNTRVTTVDASLLEHYDLAQADVVVLANVSAPTPAYVKRLQSYVERGGGLVVSMGKHVKPAEYNASFEELLGVHITGIERVEPVGYADDADPALLPHGLAGLQQAKTNRRARLDSGSRVGLRFADQTPAAITREVGRGRVVVLATSLDADWTDTPLRPGFLALSAGLVRYAAGHRADLSAPEGAGTPATLPVPAGASLVEVVGPDDVRHRFDDLSEPLLTFRDTLLSGAYRVLVAGDQAAPAFSSELSFMVEPPTDEADLTIQERTTLEADPRDQGAPVGATLVRKPLARWFLLLAAVLGIVETGLRSFHVRRRTKA